MKKVRIQTAQNVSISLDTASLLQRFLAFALDLMLIGFSSLMITMLFGAILGNGVFVLLALTIPFYTLFFEWAMAGQTPGKRVMRVRVVGIDGRAPSALDSFIRWAFRLVDIWLSLGAIALIWISTSSRSRRLGGQLSNTMVIKDGDPGELTLRDILSIEDKSSYKPVFTEVYRFEESDMLTVKAVIDRYRKYRNTAHGRLVARTAHRCGEVLGLAEVPTDHLKFLQTLLRDYIVITRS